MGLRAWIQRLTWGAGGARRDGIAAPAPARARADSSAPARLGVADLAKRLGMDERALRAVSVRYHTFSVPRRGGGKPRKISAPSSELKQVQRLILRRVLQRLKAHPAATGFERGHSIATNARHHAGQAVVVRMDIQRYFDSTPARRVHGYFRKIGWDEAAASLLTKLCTHRGCLPQGAPTSPRLSNLVNWELDAKLQKLADVMGARYSRYSDDMTFSFAEDNQERVHGLVRCADLAISDVGYTIHMKRKLNIRRGHQRQVVTGLVINRGGVRLPRKTRRWLRAVEHRLATGDDATISDSQLQGWRALSRMVAVQGGPDPRTKEAM